MYWPLINLRFSIIYNTYPKAIASAVASPAISAVVAIVPAVLPKVRVTSDVDAGPIKVTLFVPLSLSSKNSINPAEGAPFFTDSPALCTSFCENVVTPLEAIATASVSDAEPIFPASGITIFPPVVSSPPPVMAPANVAVLEVIVNQVVPPVAIST